VSGIKIGPGRDRSLDLALTRQIPVRPGNFIRVIIHIPSWKNDFRGALMTWLGYKPNCKNKFESIQNELIRTIESFPLPVINH
jgi:hypothetical protein